MFIRIVLLINSIEYKEALNEAFDCTKAAQYSAVISANHALIHRNWRIGKIIEDKSQRGNKFIDNLAAHFTIINHRGKCLYGSSIKDTFADVPVQDYIDSIWNDIVDAEEEITDNPMYLILNLARVLAYLKDGLVLSKKEGGEWALENIPELYYTLLNNALEEYLIGADLSYDMSSAKGYAKYMMEQIRTEKEKRGN